MIEKKEKLIPYWISCDLEEEDIYIDEDIRKDISHIIKIIEENNKEYYKHEKFVRKLSQEISNFILEHIIHYNFEKEIVEDIVFDNLEKQNLLYLDYKRQRTKLIKEDKEVKYSQNFTMLSINILFEYNENCSHPNSPWNCCCGCGLRGCPINKKYNEAFYY